MLLLALQVNATAIFYEKYKNKCVITLPLTIWFKNGHKNELKHGKPKWIVNASTYIHFTSYTQRACQDLPPTPGQNHFIGKVRKFYLILHVCWSFTCWSLLLTLSYTSYTRIRRSPLASTYKDIYPQKYLQELWSKSNHWSVRIFFKDEHTHTHTHGTSCYAFLPIRP